MIGDVIEASVIDRSLRMPATEHGFDSMPQLVPRVVGKRQPGFPLDERLDGDYQFLQV